MPFKPLLPVLLILEGTAFGAALGGNVSTAAAHAHALSLTTVIGVVATALHPALDFRFYGRILSRSVLGTAGPALFIRSAASLAALTGGRSIHLDTGQTALVVLKMLTALHLTFQTVHIRHLVFEKIRKAPRRFTKVILPPAPSFILIFLISDRLLSLSFL